MLRKLFYSFIVVICFFSFSFNSFASGLSNELYSEYDVRLTFDLNYIIVNTDQNYKIIEVYPTTLNGVNYAQDYVTVNNNSIEFDYLSYINGSPPERNYSMLLVPMVFEFADYKKLINQEYKLSFDTNAITYGLNVFIPQELSLFAFYEFHDAFHVGDTYTLNIFTNYLEVMDDAFYNANLSVSRSYNEDHLEYDLNFTGYERQTMRGPDPTQFDSAQVLIYLAFRIHDTNFPFYIRNIKLSPINLTKSLYKDELLHDNLITKISGELNSVKSSFDEGFSELNSNIDSHFNEIQSNINDNYSNLHDDLFEHSSTYSDLDISRFDEYYSAEQEVMSDFADDLNNIFNSNDIHNNAFHFIKRFMDLIIFDNYKISNLVVFSLSFGLVALVIGRRLNNA